MKDKKTLDDLAVLLAEDDREHREELATLLRFYFARVLEAANGEEALATFQRSAPDVVVTDVRMPALGGIDLAVKVKAESPRTPVVLVTAFADAPLLMKAIEAGADGFVPKPVDGDRLISVIRKLSLPMLQRREVVRLQQSLDADSEAHFGRTPAMAEIRSVVRKVAVSDFSVLLQGETGVGKTHLARAIHAMSGRRSGPFIQVDLGAIPDTLVESELFGVCRGAFTGAERDRPGRFQAADGGTLFLDELENLPIALQTKLLTAVETRVVEPLGGRARSRVDVRIVSAVKGDVRSEIAEKRLREDLFFRLSEFEICLPPLRERVGDIVPLASSFAAEAADGLGRPFSGIATEAARMLEAHPWPGNIRELRNTVRRAVLIEDGDFLTAGAVRSAWHLAGSGGATCPEAGVPVLPRVTMGELERMAILQALEDAGGAKMRAADLLGINYSTFVRHLKRARSGGDE